MTTPARSARTLRIGPTVASNSALTSSTCLPRSIASTTTLAAPSTSPVHSMIASIPAARATSIGSPVMARPPAATVRSIVSWSEASTAESNPASAKASSAFSTVRLAMATRSMPVIVSIARAMPRPMYPAPTIPTLMGRPSCWRRSSALSTICIMPPLEPAPTVASSDPDN